VDPSAGEDGRVSTFTSYDGTELAYHVKGEGQVLVCLPGGPGRASEYLGDLGGLTAYRQLVLLDSRGSGESAVPEDADTYRCERLVEDVEELRKHLGLERVDLLSHSAGGNLLMMYAARYPDRVGRAVLVAPGWSAVELEFTDEEWLAGMRVRSGEPWYDAAFAAMLRLDEGSLDPADRMAAAPFWFGRWTDEARRYVEAEQSQFAPAARAGFRSEGSFGNTAVTTAALSAVTAPVLLVGGELDPAPTRRLLEDCARLFGNASVRIQAGAGHSPWIDDPEAFLAIVTPFLRP
jgi:pimeloyl-ACP methyl ester carboxylesterase